jgi:hypothetical protein
LGSPKRCNIQSEELAPAAGTSNSVPCGAG